MKPLSHRIEPLEPARTERSVRVIVVGEPAYHKAIAEALADSEVTLVDLAASGDILFDKLQREEFDCIIADQIAGGQSSLELRATIEQRMSIAPALIMVTADGSAATMLRAFRKGVSDFVATDHDYRQELIHAVRHAVEQNRKTQMLMDEIGHLTNLARYDRLTGLPNRNFLDERLQSMIASAERHRGNFSVFLVDIDNFRAITDIHGHAVADQALKAFARRLMQAARSSDVFGRFGGDAFLYLIDRDVSHAGAQAACARLAAALSFPIELDSIALAMSASIGAALFPHDGRTVEELLNSAGEAMYIARTNGGGYHIAKPSPAAAGDVAAPAVPEDGVQGSSGRPTAAAGRRRPAGPGMREENRRAEHRDRVFRRGRIILGDGFSTIDCVIRDISTRGARITVDDHITIPRSLSFAVLDTGQIFPAIRRWQRGPSLGIEFAIEAVSAAKPKENAA